MKQLLKPWVGAFCTLLLAFAIAACGNTAGSTSTGTGTGTGAGTGTSTGTGTTIDLSTHGIDPKTIVHGDFTSGATHSTKLCADCHSVTRDKVCSQAGCHPFSKYTSVMTNWNHTASKTGEQCDKCHYSVEKNIASENPKVAGWRRSLRIGNTIWHTSLTGVCLDCHSINDTTNPINVPNTLFPLSHQTDVTRKTACETCHYYIVNTAGTGGKWGGGAHPAATTGCATATCHTHLKTTTETHYMGGTAPAGQHYDANTFGPFNCEWCHAQTLTPANNYTSWAVTFDKTTHQSWNSGACKACHPSGTHPAVTTGCRTATCHTHTKPTTQTHQESGYEAGHHYDANAGGSVGAGPFECEWCHKDVATGGYASWILAFNKDSHRKGTTKWDIRSCGACHPKNIP